jgi:2'-5' RNA ligase
VTLRSAVVVPFPSAAPVVDGWRERSCEAKPSAGVPPHVTLLFPFVPPSAIDEALVGRLEVLVARTTTFDAGFEGTGRFPGVLFLEPAPAEPFLALTQRLATEFPDFPPYGGAFATSHAHLTVAQGDVAVLDEAERDILPRLPLHAHVREALLLVEVKPDHGRWDIGAQLPLGGR